MRKKLIISLMLAAASYTSFAEDGPDNVDRVYVFSVKTDLSSAVFLTRNMGQALVECTVWVNTGEVTPKGSFAPALTFPSPDDRSEYSVSDLEQSRVMGITQSRYCPVENNANVNTVETREIEEIEYRNLISSSSSWRIEGSIFPNEADYSEWTPSAEDSCSTVSVDQSRYYEKTEARTNYWHLDGVEFASNVQRRTVRNDRYQTVMGRMTCSNVSNCRNVSEAGNESMFSYEEFVGSCTESIADLKWDGETIYFNEKQFCWADTLNTAPGAVSPNRNEVIYDGYSYVRNDATGSEVCRNVHTGG